MLTNFSANEDFSLFLTRLTNMDWANKCFSGRDKEDIECTSEEEDSNKKGRMPTGDIKKCCTAGKSFSLWL